MCEMRAGEEDEWNKDIRQRTYPPVDVAFVQPDQEGLNDQHEAPQGHGCSMKADRRGMFIQQLSVIRGPECPECKCEKQNEYEIPPAVQEYIQAEGYGPDRFSCLS